MKSMSEMLAEKAENRLDEYVWADPYRYSFDELNPKFQKIVLEIDKIFKGFSKREVSRSGDRIMLDYFGKGGGIFKSELMKLFSACGSSFNYVGSGHKSGGGQYIEINLKGHK